jgi:hypothetical protein
MTRTNTPSTVTVSESFKIIAGKALALITKQHPELVQTNAQGHWDRNLPWHTRGFLLNKTLLNSGFLQRFLMPYREFIGCLYFNNKEKGATHKEWVFEVYGRQHVELVRKVAEDLSEEFKVDIHVRLDSEEAQYENSTNYGF